MWNSKMYKTENDVKRKLLEQHYNANYTLLVGRANRQVGTFWAEDVVQDAYAQCLTYINAIPLELVEVNYYLHTVLRHVMTRYRSNNVNPLEVTEDMLETGELADAARACGILDEIKFDLSTLDVKDRGIIYARLFQGERSELVSRIFSVSVPYIDSLVFKFRGVIKERYAI